MMESTNRGPSIILVVTVFPDYTSDCNTHLIFFSTLEPTQGYTCIYASHTV